MKKALSFTALLVGITLVVYAFFAAYTSSQLISIATSFNYEGRLQEYFHMYLTEVYRPILTSGIGLCVVSGVLLWLFRKSSAPEGTYALILIGSGTMLILLPVLQALQDALDTKARGLSWMDSSTPLSTYFLERFYGNYTPAVLGAVFLITGILLLLRLGAKKKVPQPEAATDEEVVPETVEEEPVAAFAEEGIALFCTVVEIRGDYALVKYEDTGIESEVALALLPFGIDTGDWLKFENYEFTQV